jgi:hypothetical protein
MSAKAGSAPVRKQHHRTQRRRLTAAAAMDAHPDHEGTEAINVMASVGRASFRASW